MIATWATGEGINLRFCWFMIDHDVPWNPMRLEQRKEWAAFTVVAREKAA
jgi:hypothetical protein